MDFKLKVVERAMKKGNRNDGKEYIAQSLQPFTYLFRTVALTICVFFVLFPYLRTSIV